MPYFTPRAIGLAITIFIATAAIIITMVVINQHNRAEDERKDEQQQHDRDVSRYLGNYEQCGQAFC